MIAGPTIARLATVGVLALAMAASRGDVGARIDALYGRREQVAAEIDALLGEGLEANANDYGLPWRMARLRWWQADGTSGEKATRRTTSPRRPASRGSRAACSGSSSSATDPLARARRMADLRRP